MGWDEYRLRWWECMALPVQRESERDAHFPRHPKRHVSTESAQPHSGTALLQHTAPLQPKHSHRIDAFTQNMAGIQRLCKHRTLEGLCTAGQRHTNAQQGRLLATQPTMTTPPSIPNVDGATNRRPKTQRSVLLPWSQKLLIAPALPLLRMQFRPRLQIQ